MKNDLEILEAELKKQISLEFDKCCQPELKTLSAFIATPTGRERAENIVFEICSTQGIAIQSAMSLLDSDLPQTEND